MKECIESKNVYCLMFTGQKSMSRHKKQFHAAGVGDVAMNCFFCGERLANSDFWQSVHRCEEMVKKVQAYAMLKAYHSKFKEEHCSWAVPVKEYNVPRLYLYQAVIEEWGKAGTVDQSHEHQQALEQSPPQSN
jgi:hypothetical protein